MLRTCTLTSLAMDFTVEELLLTSHRLCPPGSDGTLPTPDPHSPPLGCCCLAPRT